MHYVLCYLIISVSSQSGRTHFKRFIWFGLSIHLKLHLSEFEQSHFITGNTQECKHYQPHYLTKDLNKPILFTFVLPYKTGRNTWKQNTQDQVVF